MGFFQTLGTGYKIMGEEAKQKIVDNRSNIFTGVSVLGTIATSIISAIAGAKSARQIDKKAAELQRDLTLKEKAQLCWKNFIAPAGAVVGSSAGAITSRVIDRNNITRLTTDVAIVSKAYNELKRASSEVLTERQQAAVNDKIAEKKMEEIPKEKIERVPDPNGGPGVSQLFVDGFNEEIKFFSTVDKVRLNEAKLQQLMADVKAREKYVSSSTMLGVKYSNWLELNGYSSQSIDLRRKDSTILKYYGWNKGFAQPDGTSNDDIISFYLSPGETEYQGQLRSCYVIVWDQDPSDMRLGSLVKSGDL